MRVNRTLRVAVLSWVAGAVDTFGYLSLGHVFVTHLTGNVGIVAIAAVQHRYSEVVHRGAIVLLFFTGALLGAALVESPEAKTEIRRALAVESTALGVYVILAAALGVRSAASGVVWFVLLLPLALAMGVQNAALGNPATGGGHTTHITGPATDFAVEIVRLVAPARRHTFNRTRAVRVGARSFSFAAGGMCGVVIHTHAPVAGPLIPATVIAAIAWLSGRQPDEGRRDQS